MQHCLQASGDSAALPVSEGFVLLGQLQNGFLQRTPPCLWGPRGQLLTVH